MAHFLMYAAMKGDKMLIPDCRNDIHYNEDFLNKDDKQYIAGFDSCTDVMEIAIAAIETANF